MGLDQAVLKGFETGASSEGSLSKEEVEKLLRHGAYDIFQEDKAGKAEAESNEFGQLDIDSILEQRTKTVVHKNTGSNSNAAGGTFSKAGFNISKTPDAKSGSKSEDIDIEDPDFWKKMIGETTLDELESESKPRQRERRNYSEFEAERMLEERIRMSPGPVGYSSLDEDDEQEGEDDMSSGKRHGVWRKLNIDRLVKALSSSGYGVLDWADFVNKYDMSEVATLEEVRTHFVLPKMREKKKASNITLSFSCRLKG